MCPDLHGLRGRPKEEALPDARPVPGPRAPGAGGSPGPLWHPCYRPAQLDGAGSQHSVFLAKVYFIYKN